MADMVYMKHPKVSGDHAPAVTSQEAFDELWKAKGWKLTDGDGNEVRSAEKAAVGAVTAEPGSEG